METLAASAGVPVWNGLTDEWHPTQALCDALTMREQVAKPDGDIAFAYLGDADNNVGNSLLVMGAMMGMDVRIVAPKELWNHDDVVEGAERLAAESRGPASPGPRTSRKASAGSTSSTPTCGSRWASRRRSGTNASASSGTYQVTMDVLAKTGNPDVRFMHCLPALHDRNTAVGEQLYEHTGLDSLEVTDEVFESAHSIVFDQAENRMHTIKAIMVATLAGG